MPSKAYLEHELTPFPPVEPRRMQLFSGVFCFLVQNQWLKPVIFAIESGQLQPYPTVSRPIEWVEMWVWVGTMSEVPAHAHNQQTYRRQDQSPQSQWWLTQFSTGNPA
jgi:hypothetical protein